MSDHDRELSRAFDGQAERFELAPAQRDPAALQGLVAFAALPPGARLVDAGCGPGLVAEAFLAAGSSVHGVDLSPEMVRRARRRCDRFGARARFEEGSVLDLRAGPFDAAISRLVIHHVEDPLAFVRAQAALVAPGGVVVACDHTADPDPERARWHQAIERARDRTHVRSLSAGELVDVLARAGLGGLRLLEEPFELDFDEWFDRGTPTLPKDEVRRRVLAGHARGFEPVPRDDGGITLRCARALVRGVRPRG
ncbi:MULTISPECIES: class I SAM-dependent methyltransferase [Anaeromyxobacter]|uniref:class I SAM-dependent methyltransferase n=1 Tax=Anaeromyxobacter TaxID=161492 RepID=UPI001F562A96|nr:MULTISPECIES: class I SAM-dependent methyltransferase [unclassified Anaeromyxobacter]